MNDQQHVGIRFENVDVMLGEVAALKAVTCDVQASTVAVIGENGSGKSTFARVVAGLVRPKSGTVRVSGVDPVKDGRAIREDVAMIFGNPQSQIVMPTVREDVEFSLKSAHLTVEQKRERVEEALEVFQLADIAHRSCYELSGGQQQLLALCGAFVRRVRVLVADEPTTFLDARHYKLIWQHLFASDRHALVVATHDENIVKNCEKAIFICKNRLVSTGDPDEVWREYEKTLQ